jgi:hypothetical protein
LPARHSQQFAFTKHERNLQSSVQATRSISQGNVRVRVYNAIAVYPLRIEGLEAPTHKKKVGSLAAAPRRPRVVSKLVAASPPLDSSYRRSSANHYNFLIPDGQPHNQLPYRDIYPRTIRTQRRPQAPASGHQLIIRPTPPTPRSLIPLKAASTP